MMASTKCALTLRQVTSKNVGSICELSVNEEQKAYVATSAITVTEARYSTKDWLQAIYADEIPLGLLVVKVKPQQANFFMAVYD